MSFCVQFSCFFLLEYQSFSYTLYLVVLVLDGVLLNILSNSEFGLFEGNLRMMEKDGKLQILKVENFQDKWMDTEGV